MKITVNGTTSYEAKSGSIEGMQGDLDFRKTGKDSFHIIHEGKTFYAELVAVEADAKSMVIRVNGNKYSLTIRDRYDALLEQLGMEDLAGSKIEDVKAPMPGLVLDVMVKAGQTISKGDPVLILEAMKMENVLKAKADAKVEAVNVAVGETVEKNQLMVKLS